MAASGGQARKKRGHSAQTALTLMARMPLGGGNVGQAVQKVGSKMNATVFFHYEIFSSICYNILQFQNVLGMTRQTVGLHHLAYFRLCMKDSITQGA